MGLQNPPKIGLTGLAWRGKASWRGVAWRDVARRGEARRGRRERRERWACARTAVGLDGLALLKGVDRYEIYPPCVEDLLCHNVEPDSEEV